MFQTWISDLAFFDLAYLQNTKKATRFRVASPNLLLTTNPSRKTSFLRDLAPMG
jgi:hypothetical protein